MEMNSTSSRFSLPMLIVLALSTSVPEKILFFVALGERQREANAQATVSWAADASKRSTSNMQDLRWGLAKSKPSFSPSLLMLNAFWTRIFSCSRSWQRYRWNGSCMNVPLYVVIIYHMTGGRKRLAVCSLEIKFAAGRVKTGCPHCGCFRCSVCFSANLILRVVTEFKKE